MATSRCLFMFLIICGFRFGMNNVFSNDFPSELHGKLAPEEFQETISKVNNQLRRSMPTNLKWLLCGFICCCCTLGCSMWPAICVNRKVKRDIEKTLEVENSRLYYQLGLNWSLAKQRSSEPVVMMEYVSLFSFRTIYPKMTDNCLVMRYVAFSAVRQTRGWI